MSNYSKDEAIKELQKKLEIEKAKFDKFVEDLDILFEKEKEYFRKPETEMNKAVLYYLTDIQEKINKLSQQKTVDKNE
jgi:hypothetical protein